MSRCDEAATRKRRGQVDRPMAIELARRLSLAVWGGQKSCIRRSGDEKC